jgi:hypothetical protein
MMAHFTRSVPSLQATLEEVARLRQAGQVVLRNLAEISTEAEFTELAQQCEHLLAKIQRWEESAPSPELCERATRALLAIHLSGLRLRMHRSPWARRR